MLGEQNLSFQIRYLQIFGLCVVFLVFMALKVKPRVSPKYLTLVDYGMVKKSKALQRSNGLFSFDSLGPSGLFQYSKSLLNIAQLHYLKRNIFL